MIGHTRLQWLQELPTEIRYENLALIHASPDDLWHAPMDTADDADLESAYKNLDAAIVAYCHIHRPFIRKIGAMTICNTGSVGSSHDGDPRASYLLIDDGNPTIRRVEYDIEKEVRRLLASDYPLKEWLAELRRRGSYVPPPGEHD
jgi:hypothetical protein